MKNIILFLALFYSNISVAVNIPSRAKLKMISIAQVSDTSGNIQMDMKIPGTPLVDCRSIEGGAGWFDNAVSGDMFNSVDIVDIDEIIKAAYITAGMTEPQAQAQVISEFPSYPFISSFSELTPDVTAPAQRGWYLPTDTPLVVKSIGGAETLKSGLYIRFIATKKNPVVDTFRVNVYWGVP